MKYLVDTNVLSEVLKVSRSEGVVRWLKKHQDECAISALTLAELAVGVEALPDGKRKSALAKELGFIQEDFQEQILPIDERVAWEWARYIVEAETLGFSPPLMDGLIAATARAWDITVVTRNVGDFPLMGVINPFEE